MGMHSTSVHPIAGKHGTDGARMWYKKKMYSGWKVPCMQLLKWHESMKKKHFKLQVWRMPLTHQKHPKLINFSKKIKNQSRFNSDTWVAEAVLIFANAIGGQFLWLSLKIKRPHITAAKQLANDRTCLISKIQSVCLLGLLCMEFQSESKNKQLLLCSLLKTWALVY